MYLTVRQYSDYNESEILALYKSVGWKAYTDAPEVLRRGFEHSLLVLAAYDSDRLIGILRAAGDGETIVFIQDLLVAPEHQRKGVGTALLQGLFSRFPSVRQIQLTADDNPGLDAFYRSQGFRRLAEIGCAAYMK